MLNSSRTTSPPGALGPLMSKAFSLRLPDKQEADAAVESLLQMKGLLSSGTGIHRLTLVSESGDKQILQVPALALRLFGEILSEMAVGHAVRVVAIHAELSTQEAADLLNVSRPTLVKLLDEGVMPHTKAGSHRRVKLTDLLAYQEQRDAASRAAMDEIAAQAQKLRMGYREGK